MSEIFEVCRIEHGEPVVYNEKTKCNLPLISCRSDKKTHGYDLIHRSEALAIVSEANSLQDVFNKIRQIQSTTLQKKKEETEFDFISKNELLQNETLSDYPGVISVASIRNAPLIDAEPIVYGRWIYAGDISDKSTYFCSCCNRSIFSPYGKKPEAEYPYCHCGAKMNALKHRRFAVPLELK